MIRICPNICFAFVSCTVFTKDTSPTENLQKVGNSTIRNPVPFWKMLAESVVYQATVIREDNQHKTYVGHAQNPAIIYWCIS